MLMKLYKEHPHLYDAKNGQYFNKDCRAEAFQQIVLEMRKIYECILTTDVKTKICTLRSQYLSYLKKEKNYIKSGIEKPNWVHCVEFLRPFLKPTERQETLDVDKILWSPEAIRMLIELYEKRPNLYDAKNAQYRNKRLRAKSLRQIVKEMRKIYESIDTTDIKNKIGTLRSQYLVHLKNEANYNKSGMETHERMAPFCVKYIEFLKPHLRFSESQRASESDTINNKIAALEEPNNLCYLKQEEIHSKSGTVMTTTSRPFWVAYIKFLKPFLQLSAEQSSLDYDMNNQTQAETDSEVPCYLSEIQSGPTPSIDPLLETLEDGVDSTRVNNKRKFKADVEAFGELIKAEMEQIEDPSKRRALRMKLLKVIAEGED
ncbi:GL22072 [Drosophila persimilis]|uniref:GL22072 n=2 Tax=Drosophila persimilis TaxID=7234 RepID=B4H6U9_DROPE|nr:GL22072 [Drosophila persimilis]